MSGSGRICGLVCLTFVLGCGGGAPDDAPVTAPVQGKVTRKGVPLAGVSVVYQPQGVAEGQPAAPSSGTTDEAGEYELSYTQSAQGALPGAHKVILTAGDGLDDEDPTKKVPTEIVIPTDLQVHDVTVPPDGLDGGAANFDLNF